MDFDDTPDEARFRNDVRDFLARNARAKRASQPMAMLRIDAAAVTRAKAWQAQKFAAGYAALTWPREWGGAGGTPMQQVIYDQEESAYDVPANVFDIGLGMCLPTMLAWAKPHHLDRYIRAGLTGAEIWCQLFSEPAAGSDLASIRTRAVRDGDAWRIDGQKVWTSGAHFSDYGLLIARSDWDAPKHAGLTTFFIDMKSPGVEIRPIRQISGDSNFNEVFFTDVVVPDDRRLGEVGQGWRVALTTLMNERLAFGDAPSPDFDEALALAKSDPAILADAATRAKLARWYVQSRGVKYTRFRLLTRLARGEQPGPEASFLKIVSACKYREIAAFALEQQGLEAFLADGPGSLYHDAFLLAPAMSIAGGTDEILRNIVAERILGLPGDVRADKDQTFQQLLARERR